MPRRTPRLIIAALALITLGDIATAAESAGKLRAQMTRAEREFIDLYNKVNTNPEFAIVCRMDTPTGSNFAVRVCQPKFVLTARARSAGERMQAAVGAGLSTGGSNPVGPNVGAGADAGAGTIDAGKQEAFRQNMLDTLQKSPELQALGQKRDELQARYDEVTRSKGKRQSAD